MLQNIYIKEIHDIIKHTLCVNNKILFFIQVIVIEY